MTAHLYAAETLTFIERQNIELAERLFRRSWPDGLTLAALRERGCSRREARRLVNGVRLEAYAHKAFGALKERLRGKFES